VIELVPVSAAEASAVVAFEPVAFAHAPDWPHDDTYDALRMSEGAPGTFFIALDGVVVGDCGWFGPPDEDGEVEIGYGLAPSARGQGVGTAAVQLLLDWVAGQGARTVRAEVLPGNEPSLRLLARLGFTDIGERAAHRILVR
jgi:RimJ/RimL family protein N-acetyltransferase